MNIEVFTKPANALREGDTAAIANFDPMGFVMLAVLLEEFDQFRGGAKLFFFRLLFVI